jgi:hypothetical protein
MWIMPSRTLSWYRFYVLQMDLVRALIIQRIEIVACGALIVGVGTYAFSSA